MYCPYSCSGVWTPATAFAGFTPTGSLKGATDGSCSWRAETASDRTGARTARAARRARRGVLLAIVRGGERE